MKGLTNMLAVDNRRMFTTWLLYIMAGICLVMPILILVMTSMMDGTVQVDAKTGKETVMEGFKNVWEIIASNGNATSEDSAAGMSLTSMCNINLVYFAVAIFVCLFVAADFRSGYAKNIFVVRAKKWDYVISKTLTGFIAGSMMLLCFFAGSMLGGAIAGLPFDLGAASVFNVVACLISKIGLIFVFVAIPLLIACYARQRSWLSILGTLGGGMLLFMMIPMLTPLTAGFMNIGLCVGGGIIFAAGCGALANLVLNKIDLVK